MKRGIQPADLYPLWTAFLLFAATTLWVPFHDHLVTTDYYDANLWDGLAPRALTGTIAHTFNLSPQGFLYLVQLFKCAWLIGLCIQLFRWLDDRMVAFFLCIMFACEATVYIDNYKTGFVDSVANAWLLIAALCVTASSQRRWLLTAAFALFAALLTHEKSLFPSLVLLLFVWLRKRTDAKIVIIPYALLTTLYLYAIWHVKSSGMAPFEYVQILGDDPLTFLRDKSLNAIGIFTSISMLWLVYAYVGWQGMRTEPQNTRRHYAAFIFAGILLNLSPLLIAYDTQRMVAGMWLAVFILIGDQAPYLNRHLSKHRALLAIMCTLQLLIPPLFIYRQVGVPLNCYAQTLLPAFNSHDHAMLLLHASFRPGLCN